MWAMNRLASSLASTSVRDGIRCHSFVSRSTTTQTMSLPFDHGSPVMKSIEMSCQGRSGIWSVSQTAKNMLLGALIATAGLWIFAMTVAMGYVTFRM
jgi:hypothetical protein